MSLTDADRAWMRARVAKANLPDAVREWPDAWANAYIEDVSALLEENDRLRDDLDACRSGSRDWSE